MGHLLRMTLLRRACGSLFANGDACGGFLEGVDGVGGIDLRVVFEGGGKWS